ncbi:hypothetical protein LTR78_000640 [Recurvomyces mirabilis]|uniref:Microbial-type PARG catalytic domain-containing protein n=1 Tax=Recurvomyces mirabilis TaxID=574656 RepID=A0AAE0WXM9_9PEZI|nr:hypothetical protein LTR78_000640 [Recurvomyces mirabilis]KAK5162294.1 hypothetical protein LTS14_000641 [Recurvomyces mirabilis]
MGPEPPSYTVMQPAIRRRDERAYRAQQTVDKVIPELLRSCPRARHGIQKSDLVSDPDVPTQHGDRSIACLPEDAPRIRLVCTDTLTAASRMSERPFIGRRIAPDGRTIKQKPNVAILNFASPLNPGGGFLDGANSQEEFVCARTTVYPSLWDSFYRLPQLGAIYTPDVMVFRDSTPEANELLKRDRYFIDVLSAGMLRFPNSKDRIEETREYGCSCGVSYCDRDRDLVIRKMKAVMRVAQLKGAERIVLGAWGCGAYGNPVKEVAKLWRKVIAGSQRQRRPNAERWQGIKEIVFAIPDRKMANEFNDAFTDILLPGWPTQTSDVATPGSDSPCREEEEDAEIASIVLRIQETELQVEESSGPRTKNRLRDILAGLNRDLAQGLAAKRIKEEELTQRADEMVEEDFVNITDIIASDIEDNSLYDFDGGEEGGFGANSSSSDEAPIPETYSFRNAQPPGLDFETSQDEEEMEHDHSSSFLRPQPSPNFDPKTGWFTGSIDQLHGMMKEGGGGGARQASSSHASPVLRPWSSGREIEPFSLEGHGLPEARFEFEARMTRP